MIDSPDPQQPVEANVPPEQFPFYEPSEDDRDPDAEGRMQQGREDLDPENALYDPWFDDADQASNWAPGTEKDG